MARAVGYLRVSTVGQAESGLGLEAQQEKVIAMAEMRGYDLVDMVEDAGLSGKNTLRPGYRKVVEMMESGEVDAVIVHSLSRLSRSVGHLSSLLELFESRGIALISVSESIDTSSAAGRLMIHVLAAVSQFEREVTAERTSAALQAKSARGFRLGQAPFGWAIVDGQLVPKSGEAKTLAMMQEFRGHGMTLAETAEALNHAGEKNRAGNPWSIQTVSRVLRSQPKG